MWPLRHFLLIAGCCRTLKAEVDAVLNTIAEWSVHVCTVCCVCVADAGVECTVQQ